MSSVIEIDDVSVTFPLSRPGLHTVKRKIINIFSSDNKQPPERKVLNDISISIKQGEVVGIIGRNGCGKSTLLRTISGIYRPSNGIVKSRGQLFLLAGIRIGFTGNLTGRENAYLYGSILGHSKEKMDKLLPSIIQFSELEDYIDMPLRTYSSGMTARLGFSVATAVQPEVLLIDEVLAVGDQEFKERSKERILEMVSNAGTVVIVSHSFGLLRNICDRLILLENGKIKASGEPSYVIDVYHGKVKPNQVIEEEE